MPIRYDIESSTGLINATAFGVLTTEEVIVYLKEVIADPRRIDPYCELFHLRDVEQLKFDAAGIQEIVRFASSQGSVLDGGKVAYVAAGDFEFGMGRMLEAYASGMAVEFRTFRGIEQAQAWLGLIEADSV